MYLYFILLLKLAIICSQKTNQVCDSRFNMVTYFSQEDCAEGKYKFENVIHECFPSCVELYEGLTKDGKVLPDLECNEVGPSRCPPGYSCTANNNKPDVEYYCVLNENSCLKYHVTYPDKSNKYTEALWKPTCLKDEMWAPKQCKGELSNGRCFCFDAIGNRLPGHQWSTKAENMTCACSRAKSELVKNPKNWFVSLHCDDEGNYEPLQCNQGQCWCVEPKTGNVISNVVPENMWTILPCYKKELYGSIYMRQCESHLYAQTKLVRELSIHGTTKFKFENLLCDGDGTYGAYKLEDGRATCVWKDNQPLGSWVVDLSGNEGIAGMNCNCARDTRIYELAGLGRTLKCLNNGNYDPVQFITVDGVKKYFCVDSDGFQTTKELFNTKPNNCATYK